MPPSTNPLRLQVIDRIYALIGAIVAGSDYFATPKEVTRRLILLDQAKFGFPVYMIFSGPGGKGIDLEGAPNNYGEAFRVLVKGIVQHDSDTVTALEQSLRDIRKKINDDTKPGAGSGSLFELCVKVEMFGPVLTDEGLLSDDGFAYFEQPVDVLIEGDFGVL